MSSQPSYSIAERLAELYRRLEAAPSATTAEEALAQICRILDDVEDEMTNVPKKAVPPPLDMWDGRMYPPQDDLISRYSNGSIVATTRGHRIEIAADGGIRILNKRTLQVEFVK